MDQLNFNAWVGNSIVDTGGVSIEQAQQINATVGNGEAMNERDPLPALWHWCAFPNAAPLDHLGADGHPRDSELLPPSPLRRRMWAGGALEFRTPIRVGDPLRRRSSVRSVTEKKGASGNMLFVTVDHAIYGPKGLSITERQDIVYLDIPKTYSPPKKLETRGDVVETITPNEALLFRYSAATFNAHRIHYDKPYATEVEKYPGLVVHGPLQATLLMRAAVAHKKRVPKYFEFRGVHPMFAGVPFNISVEDDTASLNLWTSQDGHQCMSATATWMDTI